ncbi:MAG: Gp15 family bacteriophage protein [Oscillospiraceae bacterium]|nr:Gp15 family bacteriophage protein [Oscillospiraceae bacterium]
MTDAWCLPSCLTVEGKSYGIHADYRDVLDVIQCLNGKDEPEFIRWYVALSLFYKEEVPVCHRSAAMNAMADFIACGQPQSCAPGPKLLDWQRDAAVIVADVNRVAGQEVRALPFLHWWTFIAYFNAIGEGQLSTLLRVRGKLRRGRKLEPWEMDYYRENRALVDGREPPTVQEQQEKARLERILAGKEP